MSKLRKSICIDCGESRTTKSHDVSNKRCKSCYKKSQKLKPNTDSTYKVLAASVKGGAKKRNIEYMLSLEQFKNIVKNNCYWCGEKPPLKNPKAERMPTLPAPANGIDRINNSIGYIYDNCVASCQKCNIAKNNYSEKEFLEWIKKVYMHQFQEVVNA